MKKKMIIWTGSLMTIIAVSIAFVSVNSKNDMSLLMQNVEAIAQNEGGDHIACCPDVADVCFLPDGRALVGYDICYLR